MSADFLRTWLYALSARAGSVRVPRLARLELDLSLGDS